MPALRPYPFGALAERALREIEATGSLLELSARRFHLGSEKRDVSIEHLGERVSTPIGPAAGPQTQTANGLLLALLAGARAIELKTVGAAPLERATGPYLQNGTVDVHRETPHPLEASDVAEEVVRAAVLFEALVGKGAVRLVAGSERFLFELGLGPRLDDVRSERATAFVGALRDASGAIDRLEGELPKALRGAAHRSELARAVALHPSPDAEPDELEAMAAHVLEDLELGCVLKVPVGALGLERTRKLLGDVLGYRDLAPDPAAFGSAPEIGALAELSDRLHERAAAKGRRFALRVGRGIPLVDDGSSLRSHAGPLRLAGPPLHVLAVHLVAALREELGDRVPISLQGGIDATNCPDALALGLGPLGACSDLLRPGGVGRLARYHASLAARMDEVGATTLDDFVLRAYGLGPAALAATELPETSPVRDECLNALHETGEMRHAAGRELYDRWVSEARLANTRAYLQRLGGEPRYARARNGRPRAKLASELSLFDCVSCGKCVSVCPTTAMFSLSYADEEVARDRLVPPSEGSKGWTIEAGEPVPIGRALQFAAWADLCDECGACAVFCPERGRPYADKPRFHRSAESFRSRPDRDGFCFERRRNVDVGLARVGGVEYRAEFARGRVRYSGPGFAVKFQAKDPTARLEGKSEGPIDLFPYRLLEALRRAVGDDGALHHASAARGA